MSEITITLLMFTSLLGLMAIGVPIGFGLGAVSICSIIMLWGPDGLDTLFFALSDTTNSFSLIAASLFIYMGMVLHKSEIGEDLFEAVYKWAGGVPGGLGMGTVVICALMAAMIGVSGAATIAMGLIAVPAMMQRKYDKSIALGLVQASGALGFLIPPSMMMIMYAFLTGTSTGKLFAGGVVPGLMLALMYILYISIRCRLQPEIGPAIPLEERATMREKLIATKGIVLPMILICTVLGCIFLGITSPTEAGAVGAAGALLCAAFKRKLNIALLRETSSKTLIITGFNLAIIVGAIAFSKVYTGLGATEMIKSFIVDLDVSPWVVLILMQISFFLLGMILDDLGILFLCMPIYVPIILALGFDPVWFAILYVVNMQMAFITPPYGLNLMYMKSIAPPGVTMGDIYKSVLPFIIIQALAIVILMIFPDLVLWLPRLLFS